MNFVYLSISHNINSNVEMKSMIILFNIFDDKIFKIKIYFFCYVKEITFVRSTVRRPIPTAIRTFRGHGKPHVTY